MYVLRVRRGTAAEWETANPVLHEGEFGYITDLKTMKVGDGITAWNDLNDFIASGPPGPPSTDVAGYVSTAANLPLSVEDGAVYVALDTLHGHFWSGSEWIDIGLLQGPQGFPGVKGDKGDKGDPGDPGESGLWWHGTQVQFDALPSVDNDRMYVITG